MRASPHEGAIWSALGVDRRFDAWPVQADDSLAADPDRINSVLERHKGLGVTHRPRGG